MNISRTALLVLSLCACTAPRNASAPAPEESAGRRNTSHAVIVFDPAQTSDADAAAVAKTCDAAFPLLTADAAIHEWGRVDVVW
jgi:hypothetical protein